MTALEKYQILCDKTFINQSLFAEIIGLSQSSVSRVIKNRGLVENTAIKKYKTDDLLNAFNLSLDDFYKRAIYENDFLHNKLTQKNTISS